VQRPDREHDAPRPDHTPQDPARQARAKLLRDFEQTTLTLNNFCVLKRLTPADLEGQLAQARAERGPQFVPDRKPRPAPPVK
jgi:hypothetical protein